MPTLNYIVFDLEWNQASTKDKEVKGIMFEILEIGAVKLGEDFEILDTFSSLVKPQVYKTMHSMTQKLLHFDLKAMQSERPFPYVMNDFLTWCGDNPMFCTWGPSDLTELQRNMQYYGMKQISTGPLKYYDVQKLFSLGCEDGKSRRSLEYAVDFLKIKPDEQFHSAIGDARYTAEIFRMIRDEEILPYHSYDNFHLPQNREEEIHVSFPTYSKYISRSFKNKNVAIKNKDVYHVRCNICNEPTSRVVKWFTPNGGKFYLAVVRCSVHGYLKAKARIKKLDEDRVYVVRTVKPIDKEMVLSIRTRYEKAKESAEKYAHYQKSKSSNSDL